MDKKITRPLLKFSQLQKDIFLEQKQNERLVIRSLDTSRSFEGHPTLAGRVWLKTRISTMVLTSAVKCENVWIGQNSIWLFKNDLWVFPVKITTMPILNVAHHGCVTMKMFHSRSPKMAFKGISYLFILWNNLFVSCTRRFLWKEDSMKELCKNHF